MTPALKSPRRINDRDDDQLIWAAFSMYIFLTVEQLENLLGRGHDYVQKRLQAFYRAGYLRRVQDGPFGPCMYFLCYKGGEKAASFGHLSEPKYVQKKSDKSIKHDSTITDFHIALSKSLSNTGHKISSWEQWRTDLEDIRKLVGGIPDARLAIDDDEDYSLLEVVEANESGHRANEKNLTEKLQEYVRICVPRVYVSMPTEQRVTNYLKKLEPIVPEQSIWITDEASWRKDMLGKIWRTPKNFSERQYSILKPKADDNQ